MKLIEKNVGPAARTMADGLASAQSALPDTRSIHEHIAAATSAIAPTWPLDQFIAVNPYWGWANHPMSEAAAALTTLAGTRLTMPREWFREQWANGQLTRANIEAVAREQGEAHRVDEIMRQLEQPASTVFRLPLITDLCDAESEPISGMSWTSLVTNEISQHCAAFFDHHQSTWQLQTASGLLQSWREQLAKNRGIPWRSSSAVLRSRLDSMPAQPVALIGAALDALGMLESGRTDYLRSVLMGIHGWAAWCAFTRWQARLNSSDTSHADELLAIRLAWEWLLRDDQLSDALPDGWAAGWAVVGSTRARVEDTERDDWTLQRALERGYQQPLAQSLCASTRPETDKSPVVQAVFCIDVRSERFRRALESVSPTIATRGFAGFFGLPIAFAPLGSSSTHPQLPGLLAPAYRVSERVVDSSRGNSADIARTRTDALQWRARWNRFRTAPASGFSFVETLGLFSAVKLLKSSLRSTAPQGRWDDDAFPGNVNRALRPDLPEATTDPHAAAVLVRGILAGMGMLSGFAPLVLLVGHGSQTTNNPQAAALECGACGGQTGEVNARLLADLLNTPAVRTELRALAVPLPATTYFLAALHNTTTDETIFYDTQSVPEAWQPALVELRAWLDIAAEQVRAERAASVGLQSLVGDPVALKRAMIERANNWAEVRPEWGLANNASLIIAPRERTRSVNLEGRTFLHDYDWRTDSDLSVLTLIMTAPMVVAHWINMQYYASTLDNLRYGSGNKTLHNVVGGRIGVFEGNTGDLRIGLAQQSLHDGNQLCHTPLRLSVFIEAPRSSIQSVLASHEIVRQLVDHEWLHLFRIDHEQRCVEHYRDGVWTIRAHADEGQTVGRD